MSKATTAGESKVLRIGVIQGGRIVEERLLRKTATVTVGQSPRNTFAIPIAHLPASYALFEVQGGHYHLRFVRGMEGRVSTAGGEVVHLKALVERGLVQQQGKHFLYRLDQDSRGKVVLGDITLLYQFVTPPPPVAKLQLPTVMAEPWWRRLDGFFGMILLASFVLQAGSIGGIEYWWETVGQFEQKIRPKRNIRELLPVDVVKRTEAEEEKRPIEERLLEDMVAELDDTGAFADDGDEPTADDLKVDDPGPPRAAGGGAEELDPKKRYERRLSHVRTATILKFVGSAGGGPGGPPNTLAEGASGGKLADAWAAQTGVAVASPGEHRLYQGVPAAARTEGDGDGGYRKLAGKGGKYTGEIKTGKVETAAKGPELKVKVQVGGELGSKTGIGQIDKESVASVFRRRRSAVRRCYEESLRANPNVQGKVIIQFTIGTAGRITTIDVTTDTTGDGKIAQCIVRHVKGWRFDPPERGTVTFSYPFILSRG
jgi:hypothetical protein